MIDQTLPYNPKAPDILLHEHWLAVRERFLARHEKALADVGTLYHYTTADGLKSILASRDFWATSITHLNDSSELEYGLNLFLHRVAKLKDERKNEAVSQFAAAIDERFKFPTGLLFPAYVVCFCENGNLLSQWRGYGSGGGGYSIGLSPAVGATLEGKSMTLDQGILHLRQVIYDTSEQAALLDELLHGLVPVLEQCGASMHPEQFRVEVMEAVIIDLQMHLADLLPCFKSHTFSEEQEWRYIYFASREPMRNRQFRVRDGNFVPYVSLRLLDADQGPLEVSEVVCGPTLNSELSTRTVWQLTNAYGHENVSVLASGIPLRF
ncbi:DUF2971 domain-containing protein [Paraburkholderia ferrariae]|uniref:DUF2971 domain-containing protein n=1 Tax=Paraburkholderia ferrariae TaxID=386056 RepID=A0ABU9RYE2_9BURK